MAKAYIANKPVRFDRNYKVGEVIPDGVISPQMGRRLIEMGRILCVDIPDTGGGTEPPQGGAEPSTDGTNNESEVNPQGETETLQKDAEQPQEGADGEGEVNTASGTGSAGDGESDPQSGAEKPQDGLEEADKVNSQGETSDAAEGESDGAEGATGELTAADLINGTVGEFVCEVCGRKFQSQQGLAAHSRSHRE